MSTLRAKKGTNSATIKFCDGFAGPSRGLSAERLLPSRLIPSHPLRSQSDILRFYQWLTNLGQAYRQASGRTTTPALSITQDGEEEEPLDQDGGFSVESIAVSLGGADADDLNENEISMRAGDQELEEQMETGPEGAEFNEVPMEVPQGTGPEPRTTSTGSRGLSREDEVQRSIEQNPEVEIIVGSGMGEEEMALPMIEPRLAQCQGSIGRFDMTYFKRYPPRPAPVISALVSF